MVKGEKIVVVLITGGSRGIGAAIAEKFAAQGDTVVINYRTNDAAAQAVAQKTGALAIKADVSDSADVTAMFDEIRKKVGKVDVLVNNAGVEWEGLLTDMTEDEWDKLFDVNVKGAFLCSKAAIGDMLSKKCGRIINVSSMWGIAGASCEVAYSASKAALIGFTKALAKELAPSKITVNAVAPGCVDTDMMKHYTEDEMKDIISEIPLGRMADPREIADAVYFLSQSSFITGEVLSVNGGQIV
ncbi:MAG: 3-oxoacyl-ACP reductase FabG [Clostridia bacterium]|nr:3-oxoacyl-ACP reductase FabG [Clostridia bacterium]